MSMFTRAWLCRGKSVLMLCVLVLSLLIFSSAQAQVSGCSKDVKGEAFSLSKGHDPGHLSLLQHELKLSGCSIDGKKQDLTVSFYAQVANKVCAIEESRESKEGLGQDSDLYIEWADGTESNMSVDHYSAILTGMNGKFLEIQGHLSSGKFKNQQFKLRFDDFEYEGSCPGGKADNGRVTLSVTPA